MKTKIVVEINTTKQDGKEKLNFNIYRKGGVPLKYGSFVGSLHIGICAMIKKLTEAVSKEGKKDE